MRRLALLFVLAFLTCDLSGLDTFLVKEQCPIVNDTQQDRCPPTCVRCTDCAQPIVSMTIAVVSDLFLPQFIAEPMPIPAVSAPPHDILHIPKASSLIA